MVTYWKDIISGVIIRFDTEWDAKEMKTNPEYVQAKESDYAAYKKLEAQNKE